VKRRWKVLLATLAGLAVLLAANTVATDNETKSATLTADGGQILELTSGAVQVVDEGPRRAQPIVLIHGFGGSLQWWDRLVPLLAGDHRVVRIDLLGFGGSEKPSTGYSMPEQGSLVAEAMGKLDVQGAVVVGHSLGFDVATSLAEGHSELVDRVVDIDESPEPSFNANPLIAKLSRAPVLGEALWRITPDFAVKQGYGDAFAPDYDLEDGFENPDQVIEDFNAMTYTSFDRSPTAEDDFEEEVPLDQRVAAAAVPLLVIFGTEDQVQDDPAASAQAYADVPGAEIEMIGGAGHSPHIEKPTETAALIERFARESHYEPPPPERSGSKQAKHKQAHHDHKGDRNGGGRHGKGKNRNG
jgi:pimeloyl-ACP methyl ester carboxylesterase